MEVVLIAHDIRSSHNIGSLARSADSFGVKTIYCTGITPYIRAEQDERLPHIRNKIIADIHKTALGAEATVDILHKPNLKSLFSSLRKDGFDIIALEQSESSVPLKSFNATKRIALLLGTETTGLPTVLVTLCDQVLEIPMLGKKESLNVSVAGAIAMYELKRSELY
ncbi:MAG: TrmH family RNA methyltransferase [Patescibacteria group bacterium]